MLKNPRVLLFILTVSTVICGNRHSNGHTNSVPIVKFVGLPNKATNPFGELCSLPFKDRRDMGIPLPQPAIIINGVPLQQMKDIVDENYQDAQYVEIQCKNNFGQNRKLTKQIISKFKHAKSLRILNAAFDEIEKGAFEGFDYLTNLDLAFNFLVSINGILSRNLPRLQSLILAHNKLDHRSLIVMKNMKKLKCIDLSYNSIQSLTLPKNDFWENLQWNEIRIHGNILKRNDLKRIGLLRKLRVLEISLDAELEYIFQEKFSSCNLQEFVVRGGTTLYLNLSNLKWITRLAHIGILDGRLQSVPTGNEATDTSVKSLSLSKNQIMIIFNSDFKTWRRLERLNLSFNIIEYISENAFSLLKYLTDLFLDGNKLSSLNGNILKNNILLRRFSISQNDIVSLPANLFSHVELIDYFNLSSIKPRNLDIIDLPPNLFWHLIVSDNPLTFIFPNKARSNYTYMEFVFLLEFIPVPTREALETYVLFTDKKKPTKVTVVTRKNLTRIRYVDRFIEGQESISLDISQNDISTINNGDFTTFPRLQFLCLQFNKIWEITPYSFINCNSMKMLDLAHNRLKNINALDVFFSLNNLIFLNLAYNELYELPYNAFIHLRNIRLLNISNNPIRHIYICPLMKCSTLTHLDVSNTNIQSIFNTRYGDLERRKSKLWYLEK
ncbi:hypothetical protein ACOME3_008239 [Neoechinorhynchus agilis]